MVEPREPTPTIKFVDDYCQWYKYLFPEVRTFEAFKYLHVGMISDKYLDWNNYTAAFDRLRDQTIYN